MDDLIIRVLQGRASEQDRVRLDEWRSEAAENERHFRMMQEIWSLTAAASPDLSHDPGGVPNPEALIARAELLMPGANTAQSPTSQGATEPSLDQIRRYSRYRLATAAAVAAALVGIGIGLGSFATRPAAMPDELSSSEIVTGQDERMTVTLGDGSAIRLGPNSRLRLSQQSNARGAFLEGRAFFAVRRDPSRPFTVQTGSGEAQVLGTRFEVRTDEDEFRVMVVEGEVAVAVGDTAVRVTDGEVTRSADGSALVTESAGSVFEELGWLGNAVIFEATPLRVAIAEIRYRYGTDVTIENPELSEMEITASFTGRPVDEVLLVICETISATCTSTPGGGVTMR